MKAVIQFLLIYTILFGLHTYAWSQTEAKPEQPAGLCQKPVKKCNVRELTPAEIDTATAMADEVAYQLMQLDELEKREGREFKVALIGRAGTDLGKFQVLKDAGADGKYLNMDQLVTQIESDSPERADGGGPSVNYRVLKNWMDDSRQMEYSHIGIALRNHPKSDKRFHWQIMHLLWTCEKDPARGATEGDRSYIWEEGLGAVFADDMKEYKAQIMILKPQIQTRIENFLLKEKVGAQWHNSKYNAAALSNDLDQQNSNQWVLEVLAAALKPDRQVKDRAAAQQVLRETGYMETKVALKGFYSLLNLPFVKNLLPGTICMKKQPYFGEGFGQIISVLSVEEYMQRNQLLVRAPVEVQLPDELNFVKQERQKKQPTP